MAYDLAFAAGTPLVLVLLFQAVQRAIAPAAKGAPARAVLQASYLFGVLSVAAAVVAGCVHGESLGADLTWTAAFGGAAVLLLVLVGRLGVGVLLKTRLEAEIARGNLAAAIAAGAHYVATAILLSRCLYGDDLRTLGVSIAFFALGTATLHAFVLLFRALTVYDDFEQIVGGNVAAALSYAGVTIALALIIGHASEGPFTSWKESLVLYGKALVYAAALYPVRQILVEGIVLRSGFVLRRGRLDDGIARDKDVGLGVLEAAAYLATAFFVGRVGG